MADFKITNFLEEKLKIRNRDVGIRGVYFNKQYTFMFLSPINTVLSFKNDLSVFQSQTAIPHLENKIVKVVSHEGIFILISSVGKIYKYISDSNFSQLQTFPLNCILAITEFKQGFACLGKNKDGDKQFISFELDFLPNFEDCTFNDLNENNSEDYYLTSVKTQYGHESLIISDHSSGKTYLCTENGQVSIIHVSKFPLISAFSIISEGCLLLCFENGKLYFHFFSQDCHSRSLFLNKKVLCIEKCFCNDSCFLWSGGANLQHTEISFEEGDLTIRNFKVQGNIVGVISLFKVGHYIIAISINNMVYEISIDENARKEIFRAPSEILSQIYNESLKINDIQKKLESASEYLQFKEKIQNNEVCWTLNCEGNDITLKNMLEMTFKKEIWKIEFRAVHDEEFVWVKVLKLETDVTSGMMIKVKNPFDKSKRLKVYLTGIFDEEILTILIGTVWEEATEEKKNLKKLLNQFKQSPKPNYLL